MKTVTHGPADISFGKKIQEPTAVVSGLDSTSHIPLFQKSDGTWYCRFSASQTGTYTVQCGNTTKTVSVKTYQGSNVLFSHGPVQLSGDKQYLVHADGKPFFWLADTWWFAGTRRMTKKDLSVLLADRKKKGFTVVLIVAGIPPEISVDSSENIIDPVYFDNLDEKIEMIVASGIVPCIVGSWGHHIEVFGEGKMKILWREIIARYASYPVMFSLTGEVDVFLNTSYTVTPVSGVPHRRIKTVLARFAPSTYGAIVSAKRVIQGLRSNVKERSARKKRIEKWRRVGEFATKLDTFGRLWSVHPHSRNRASSIMGDPTWLSVDAIQSSHTFINEAWMVEAIIGSDRSKRPIVNMEPWYEGILGNFDDRWQRYAFWMCILAGAKGHTYGAHGVWQMAKGDNFMDHWGRSDWKRAKDYSGSLHMGIGKRILESIEWWKLTPAVDAVAPHWSSFTPEYPLAARIGNEVLLVYCSRPEVFQIRSGILPQGVYEISWIDPKTGKRILSLHTESVETMKVPAKIVSDALLIVRKHEKTAGKSFNSTF